MLTHYLKVAVKVLVRRKLFTAISLFGISVTLVVLMVATAIVDHVVAPLPPETRQDRTLGLYSVAMLGERGLLFNHDGVGFGLLDRHARDLPGVERMSIWCFTQLVSSYVDGSRVESLLKRTDGEFWRILDFEFLEGGPFSPDDVEKARHVAVINATTRRRLFGDAPAVGRAVEADGLSFWVVGVVSDVSDLRTVASADIWVPISADRSATDRPELMGAFGAIFLARSCADFPLIKEEFEARLRAVELPQGYERIVAVPETQLQRTVGRFVTAVDERVDGSGLILHSFESDMGRISLTRFWAAAGLSCLLFMLLPTLNLVNLSVSRILERGSEIGVRKAFGASSGTLVGQFVVEHMVLTLAGGAVGFILSRLVLEALEVSGLFGHAQFSLNGRVFLYGLTLAVLFGVLSGVYPAWRMSRLHPVQALEGAAR